MAMSDVRVMSQVGGQNPKAALGCGVWPTSRGGDDNYYANTILPTGLLVTDAASEASLAQIHTDTGTTIPGYLQITNTILGAISATVTPPVTGHPSIVGATGVIASLVAARPLRAAVLFQNQDAVNTVGVSTAAAATFAQCPILLQPGQALGLAPVAGSELAWFSITNGATVNVGVVEMY